MPEDEFYARLGEVRQAAGDRAVLRAIHVYEDNKRVRLQLRALENDNFPAFLEYVKESGDMMKELQNVAKDAADSIAGRKRSRDDGELRSAVKSAVSSYLFKNTRRNPMVIPVVTRL